MAKPGNGSGNGFEVPFVFVKHGDPLPREWMARHPDWVKFPATLVVRREEQAGVRSVPPVKLIQDDGIAGVETPDWMRKPAALVHWHRQMVQLCAAYLYGCLVAA